MPGEAVEVQTYADALHRARDEDATEDAGHKRRRVRSYRTALALLAIGVVIASVGGVMGGKPGADKLPGADLAWLVIGAAVAGLALAAMSLNSSRVARIRLWHNRLELGTIIMITGLVAAVAFVWRRPTLAGVATMGLIVLFTVLIGGNTLGSGRSMRLAEVRTAITVSTVAVLFGLIGFGEEIELAENGLLTETVENFWKVVVAVVSFHFAGAGAERVAATLKRSDGAVDGSR